jgi:TonB family protein
MLMTVRAKFATHETMASMRLLFITSLTVIALSGCTIIEVGLAFQRARAALAQRDYERVLENLAITDNYQNLPERTKAEVGFLRATSYEGLGRLPEARSEFQHLAETYPKTSYGCIATQKLKDLDNETVQLANSKMSVEDRQYFRKVKSKIDSFWTYPCMPSASSPDCNAQDAELLIEMGVEADGRVAFVKLKDSSGISEYDESALVAINKASPFDPVPQVGESRSFPLTLQMHFKYRKGASCPP